MRMEAVNATRTALAAFAAGMLAFAAEAQQPDTAASSPAPAPAAKAMAPAVKDAAAPAAPVAPAAKSAVELPAAATPAGAAPKSSASDPDSYEAIAGRMRAAKKAMEALEGQIAERTKRIQEMFDGYNKAERNLTGFNGLGQVEQMELKAELYGGERMARKKLGEEFSALSSSVEQWSALKVKQKENQRLLALRNQIQELQKAGDSKTQGSKEPDGKLTDIEYYQVKKDADLRTISAYPEVYGTPEFWDYLYKANKDKLQDPDKLVPAGTTLIVPQDVKKLPDFNDL